jgi:hypothetical protein
MASMAVVGEASENEPVATIDPSIRRVLAATVSHSIIARIRCCARLTRTPSLRNITFETPGAVNEIRIKSGPSIRPESGHKSPQAYDKEI